MNNISEEKLQELGIFEIRNIARDVGVYSPTLFKKQELIDKIMKIMSGKEEPYIKKTKQGRPPKNIFSLNNFIDVFMPGNVEEKPEKEGMYFNDVNENINVEVYGSNEKIFKGLVKVYADEYALVFKDKFIEDKNVVYINSQQTKFYNLKTGDYVTGKAVFVDETKPFILKEIYTLNSSQFNKSYTRCEDFDNKIAIISKDKLKTNIYKLNEPIYSEIDLKTPLARGQRILIKGKTNLSFDILHKLTTDSNNLKGEVVLIDDSPENFYEVGGNNKLDAISNNFSVGGDVELELEVKIAKLKRSVELGEDVILFVNSIEKLFNFLVNQKILKKVSKDEALILAKNYINNLILLGKNTQNGSLTVIFNCLDDNNDYDSLFNNIIYLYEKHYEVLLNEHLSHTQNLDKILTKSEFLKLKEIQNSQN